MSGDGTVHIHGWSTTTAAVMTDLDQLATTTRSLAGEVFHIGAQMRAVGVSTDLLETFPLSPATALSAENAVLAATVGPCGALVVAAQLDATALMVSASAEAYRVTESTAESLISAAQFTGGLLLGVVMAGAAEGVAVVGGYSMPGGFRPDEPPLFPIPGSGTTPAGAEHDWASRLDEVERFLEDHPALVQQLAAGGGGLMTGVAAMLAPAQQLDGALPAGVAWTTRDAALALSRQFTDGTAEVARVPDPPARRTGEAGRADRAATPAPTRLSDLFAGLAADIAASDLAGRITVRTIRTTAPDGGTRMRYLVNLPGMDSFDLPGHQSDDVRDNSGNLRLIGGLDSAYTRGVELALRLAGVPDGAHLALVGHSQGGLAAVELAGDPTFTHRYRVSHVLTAGAPISRLAKNPAVDYLALENSRDIVPRLDGASTTPLPNVTVAEFSLDTGSIGGNHDMALYARLARELDTDAAADADLRRYLESLTEAGFLVGHDGTSSSDSQAFRITSDRRPAGSPQR